MNRKRGPDGKFVKREMCDGDTNTIPDPRSINIPLQHLYMLIIFIIFVLLPWKYVLNDIIGELKLGKLYRMLYKIIEDMTKKNDTF